MTTTPGGIAPAQSTDATIETDVLATSTAAAAADGAVAIQGRTPWQIIRARVGRDKVTMTALVFTILFVIVAATSPLMVTLGWIDPNSNHSELVQGLGSMPEGTLGGISGSHWLGVEPGTGRDVLSRIVTGMTTSLTVALFATLFAIVVGTILGIVSGFALGRTDWWISRGLDLVLSFPSTVMLLSLSPVLVSRIAHVMGVGDTDNKAKITFIALILGVFGFPFFARIIRGQVMSLREREFIEAARSLGAGSGRIYFKELLPHLWAPILVYTTLILPANIAAEASLGFLGVSVTPPTASLGAILNDSVTYARTDPAFFLFPGLTVFFIVLALNLLGDGLRDALDPKAGRS
jgi:peptide/nickel transport system permease protein